jgi:ribonuclease P protein component
LPKEIIFVPKQFTLGKNERLKSRKLIEQLFKTGKSFNTPPFRVYYQLTKNEKEKLPKGKLQFGAGVSSRNFKKAVDRNRIKRLTREAYRLQNFLLKERINESEQSLSVFFIYTGRELPDFNLVKDKTVIALKKLIKIIDETAAANT